MEKGDVHVYVAEIGSESDERHRNQLLTVKLDPDTGRLTPANGINLGGFKFLSVGFSFDLNDARGDRLCVVELSREFSKKGIRVAIKQEAQDGPTFRREFMAALESKVKLAEKLKQARKTRRQAAKPGNDGIYPNATKRNPKNPDGGSKDVGVSGEDGAVPGMP